MSVQYDPEPESGPPPLRPRTIVVALVAAVLLFGAFRVLDHGPYREKTLRAELRRREVGRLEILVRGLDVDPNALRPRLKLAGTHEATVVLTRIGRGPHAFVCAARPAG